MFGIIGGSGLGKIAELTNIHNTNINTPYGATSAPIQTGELAGQPVAFLARHGTKHLLAPHEVNYRANLWALREVGVTHVIGVGAVGGIGTAMAPGILCIADQIIDYTYGRDHTYSVDNQHAVQHIDFTEPYCESLRQQLIQGAQAKHLAIQTQGVYGATQGPRLESAAEIRRMQRDGCDLVGMTGMPEASLAREIKLCYANISLVVNWAAGLADGPITMQEIEQHLAHGMQSVVQIILGCVSSNLQSN